MGSNNVAVCIERRGDMLGPAHVGILAVRSLRNAHTPFLFSVDLLMWSLVKVLEPVNQVETLLWMLLRRGETRGLHGISF